MAEMSDEQLAEILWDARKVSLGDRDDDNPFGEASARIQEQYRRFAAEVAKRIDQDRDAELERLRAELADREQRLNQATQDEARITHEWEQASMALENIGRVLDGGETS